MTTARAVMLALALAGAWFGTGVLAQGPQTPRAAAPVDLTGYWVSVVTTEWRYRMMTPPKGDFAGLQLTAEARALAEAWDPARDAAAGQPCRAYGAPAIMQMPARLHITWADERTLKMEVDEGTQTRLFVFGGPPATTARSWQGQSQADWQMVRPGTGGGPPSAFAASSSLRVVTSGLRSGYIRRNGVPYSENALLTEFFAVVPGPHDEQWLIVTTRLVDPKYLQQPLIRSVQFEKQADGAGWAPAPCTTTW